MDVWQPQLCKFSCKESFEAPKESIPKTVFWNLIELMHIFQKIFLVQNILKMFCVIFPVCIRTTVIFSSRYQPNSGWTFLGLLTDGGGGGGERAKSSPLLFHTYPTIMKLGSYTLPKEDLQYIWVKWHTPWVLLKSAFFQRKSGNFTISRNTDMHYVLMHNF